jgi:hypothetical protein
MVSEVLRIAPRLVQVDYVFENTGSSDVTTLVAFPLPDLPASYESLINIAFPQAANFVEFQVWIDGREIKPDIEVRAFDDAREITAELKRLGVDLISPNMDDPSITAKLRSLDHVEGDNKTSVVANWVARVSFHWSQTFPAGSASVSPRLRLAIYPNGFTGGARHRQTGRSRRAMVLRPQFSRGRATLVRSAICGPGQGSFR